MENGHTPMEIDVTHRREPLFKAGKHWCEYYVVVLGLPFFDLDNPKNDQRKSAILEFQNNHIFESPILLNSSLVCHQISTLLLQRLCK